MADTKSKAELDRDLYEYQRQLDAPKIYADKFPSISEAVDPYILHKSDKDVYNKLGQNTDTDATRARPFNWVRRAEEKATDALTQDYYKTQDPKTLLDKLKSNDNLDYKYKINPNLDPTLSGAYIAELNTMEVNPKEPALMDTIVHEHGHAVDAARGIDTPVRQEPVFPNKDKLEKWDNAYRNDNLYDLSNEISTGHFSSPRSFSINNLINKSKELAKREGLVPEPDKNPQYDSLNYIKPTLKQLQGYDPSSQDLSSFTKLKRLLKK